MSRATFLDAVITKQEQLLSSCAHSIDGIPTTMLWNSLSIWMLICTIPSRVGQAKFSTTALLNQSMQLLLSIWLLPLNWPCYYVSICWLYCHFFKDSHRFSSKCCNFIFCTCLDIYEFSSDIIERIFGTRLNRFFSLKSAQIIQECQEMLSLTNNIVDKC